MVGASTLLLLAPPLTVSLSFKQEPKRAKTVACAETAPKVSLVSKFQENSSASSNLEGRLEQ